MRIKNRYKYIVNNFKKYKIFDIIDSLNLIKKYSCKKLIENIEIVLNFKKNNKIFNNDFYNNFILPNSNGRIPIIGVISKNNINYNKNYIDFIGINNILNILNSKKNNIDILFLMKDSINYFNINLIKNKKIKIPNKNSGTIISNFDTIKLVKEGYKIFYKSNNNIVNLPIGKLNFSNEILIDNIESFINHIKNKFNNKSNNFIKSIYLTSTMGLSYKIF